MATAGRGPPAERVDLVPFRFAGRVEEFGRDLLEACFLDATNPRIRFSREARTMRDDNPPG
jgi:hypothetical protein